MLATPITEHTPIPEPGSARRSSLSTTSTVGSLNGFHADREKVNLEANVEDLELKSVPTRTAQLTTTISRTLSRVRTSDKLEPGPPPDGGLQAWLLACLTHLVIFNTWGFINSFGVFQTYYVETAKIGSNSDVAWIGSAQVFILFGMGTFTGRALDGGYFRITFIVGSVLYIIGMFMLSLCKTYWQVFLAQTVCIGIGFGCVFVPSMALLSTYFLKNRPYALSIAVCGTVTGGLVFPAIAERMLPEVGYGWTVRTMAFVELVIAVICCVFMKPRLPPRKSGPIVEWSAFTEKPYTLYLCGSFFFFWSVYIGFFFVGTYGVSIIGISRSTSINLLMAMNGIGIIGRVAPAFVAKHVGPLNVLIPIVVATGIVGYSWLVVNSAGGLWAFAMVYGTVAAGIQGLFPVVLTSLTTDAKKLGVRTGMGFGIVGFAVLTGPPIAGTLIQREGGGYTGVQIYAGTCMLVSAAFLVAARWAKVGWTSGKV